MALSIEDRIQALPQELKDHIFDYLIIPPSDTWIYLPEDPRPPICLSINRATRGAAGPIYYGNNNFVMPTPESYNRWIAAIDPGFRRNICAMVMRPEGRFMR